MTQIFCMVRLLLIFTFCVLNLSSPAQQKTDAFLADLLHANKDSVFKTVLQNPDSFRLQVIYTQIDRSKNNQPHFTSYYFNYDPEMYFNPASMVKFPLSILALEKLNTLKQYGIDKYTTIQIDSSQSWQTSFYRDNTAANGSPTIAHFIKRAMLVSENDPYNRLYQFVGQQEINRNLESKGYNARISRQFLGLSPEQNRHTNAIRFVDAKGKELYNQPAAYNPDGIDFSKIIKLGKAHMNASDSIVNEPFDFTVHNFMSLESMQSLLRSIMFPNSVPPKQRFNLTEDDYRFLYKYMSQLPSESKDPKYDTTAYFDSYVKFFFKNSSRKMPADVRVFNKVGWSYGFITDVSYVVDFKNNIEFMLAATIYVNSDGIINDGKYEYNSVGYPFMYQLGQTIYQHELKRKRKFKPDLSSFKIEY